MNNNLNQHYHGYELLIKQLDEGMYRYEKSYIPIVFGFMGFDSIQVVNKYLGNNTSYQLFGGYDEAFSKLLVIGEDLVESDYVCCLKASFNTKYHHLTHRDVLGAVYNLGIDKDRYGDMWVEDGNIYLYTTIEMSYFIKDNLTQIGKAHVSFEQLDYMPVQTFKYASRNATISSYRLDKVLAAIIKKSREKAQEMIKHGLINVNFRTIEECDFLCNNGDIISVRGIGRFKIGDEIAVTKAGNVIVEIKQYI